MVAARRSGFTLVEAIVSLTLSSVLIVLVSSVFLVQNRYFALQIARTAAQDNARAVTEMVASEIRSVTKGGVALAENKRLVVRSPMVMGVVCASGAGPTTTVHLDGGDAGVTAADVAGLAQRNALTGAWTYSDGTTWASVRLPGGTPAAACKANGADTVGAYKEFVNLSGTAPALGTVIMLYRKVEYKFAASGMTPGSTALFRGAYGGTLVEFATGVDTTAQFQYRTTTSTYANSVLPLALPDIIAIRIQAMARRKPPTGGVGDVTAGWSVNVFLRNLR
jgi:type II secretory pathway pseudopilin PulG